MRRRVLGWKKAITVGLIAIAIAQGLLIHRVRWDGDAPISWEKISEVNDRVRWRPFWWATPRRILNWLDGELVGQVEVRWGYPGAVTIIAHAPRLLGAIPKGERGQLVDGQGRLWASIPLSVTHYPALWLPKGVRISRCLEAVRQTVRACAQNGISARAIWVSPFGEVAVCLPNGDWLRLGNPFALTEKMRLGLAMHRQREVPTASVLDLSGLTVIGIWHQPSR